MPFEKILPSPLGTGLDPWTGSPNPTSEELEKPNEVCPKTNHHGEPYYHLKSGIRKRNVWTTNKVGTYMKPEMAYDETVSKWYTVPRFLLGTFGIVSILIFHLTLPIVFLIYSPFWLTYFVFVFWLYKHLFTPAPYVFEDVPVPKCAKDWGKSVCVIGCGASGVATVKELKEVTDDFVCYERRETHGGIFDKILPFYMTSSSQTTLFWTDWAQAFLMDPIYLSSDQYCDYMRVCLEKSGALPHVKFGHDVIGVTFTEDRQKVEVTVRENASGKVWTEVHDHVIVASGSHAYPKTCFEKTPGLKENYKGDFHYGYDWDEESEEKMRGKKTIMVGGGEYGAHLASSLAPLSSKLYISIRSLPGHNLNRYIKWDEPREEVPQVDRWICCNVDYNFTYGLWGGTWKKWNSLMRLMVITLNHLLTANENGKYHKHIHRMFEINDAVGDGLARYGTKAAGLAIAVGCFNAELCGQIMEVDENGVVHTEDGRQIEDVEVICAATGMTDDFVKWILDPEIYEKLGTHRDRWFHIVHPDFGTKIMFCGFQRPCTGSIPSMSETQARIIARLISGSLELPDREGLQAEIDNWKHYHLDLLGLHQCLTIPSLTDWLWCQRMMTIFMGNMPNLWDLFWYDPSLFWKFQTSAGNNLLWRLTGVGAKKDAPKRLHKHPRGIIMLQLVCIIGWVWSWFEAYTLGAFMELRENLGFGYAARIKHYVDEYYERNKMGIADRSSWLY